MQLLMKEYHGENVFSRALKKIFRFHLTNQKKSYLCTEKTPNEMNTRPAYTDKEKDAETGYFFHSDHLGSASWITDGSGLPVQHLLYLPFGEHFVNEQSASYDERFTFTGKERDAETGTAWNTAMRRFGKLNTN